MALASSGGYCARSSSGVLLSISSFVGSGRKTRPEVKEIRWLGISESTMEVVEELLESDFRCFWFVVTGSARAGVPLREGVLDEGLGAMVEVDCV